MSKIIVIKIFMILLCFGWAIYFLNVFGKNRIKGYNSPMDNLKDKSTKVLSASEKDTDKEKDNQINDILIIKED